MLPRTLYRIKCMLAVILGVKNKMVASTSRVKKTHARSLQHKTQTSLDTDRSRPTREGTSRRPYAEAHAQVRLTALPAFQGSLFERKASSHHLLQSQSLGKAQIGSREPDESAPPSPQRIIAFFGDTNYINNAQIWYGLRDKPLALGRYAQISPPIPPPLPSRECVVPGTLSWCGSQKVCGTGGQCSVWRCLFSLTHPLIHQC